MNDCRPFARLARVCLGLVLLSGLGLAHAYDPGAAVYGISSEYAELRTVNSATHFTSNWTVSANGVDGVKIGKDFTMAAPGGRAAANTISGTMTKRQVIMAGAKVASRAAGAIGAGLLLYDIYDHIRTRSKATNPAGDGLWWDPGQAQTTTSKRIFWSPTYCPTGQFSSAQAAADCGVAKFKANKEAGAWYLIAFENGSCASASDSMSSCTINHWKTQCDVVCSSYGYNTTDEGYGETIDIASSIQNVTECPASTGFDETIPAGLPVGPDGKCRTGTYTTPRTPDEVADDQAAHDSGHMTDGQYKDMMDEVLGREPVPTGPDNDIQVGNSVPMVTGPTTTTTSTNAAGDGVVTEVATGWNFARDPLRKTDGTWSILTTTTTTTPAGGGAPTTTTSTTTTTQDGTTTGDTTDAADPVDVCKANPGTVMCTQLGTAPDGTVPKSTATVDYSAEVVDLPSGCPPDVPLIDGMVLSYARACDMATSMRPVVIAAAAVTALLMCVFALRGQ